jgi:hypothetical protein
MCQINLQDSLAGAPEAGGTWTYTSGGSQPYGGSLAGDNPLFDSDGLAAGVYTFDYVIGAGTTCESDPATLTITILDGVLNPLVSFTDCDDSTTSIDIGAALGGAAANTASAGYATNWVLTGSPTGFVTSTGIQPMPIGAGTYTYTYTVVGGDVGCEDCVGVYTLIIGEGGDAGDDASITLCN